MYENVVVNQSISTLQFWHQLHVKQKCFSDLCTLFCVSSQAWYGDFNLFRIESLILKSNRDLLNRVLYFQVESPNVSKS